MRYLRCSVTCVLRAHNRLNILAVLASMPMPMPMPPPLQTAPRSGTPLTVPPAGSSSAEDATALRMRRAWRSVVSSIIVTMRAAEKAAKENKSDAKEVDDAIVTTLRARSEFRKQLTLLEGKLTGQAQEIEALESCMRSQPRLGKRKRRQTDGETIVPLSINDLT